MADPFKGNFLSVQIAPQDFMLNKVNRVIAVLPTMTLAAPMMGASRVADIVVEETYVRTPVDTQALQASTGYEIVPGPSGFGVEVDILQDAENVRTGYHYAKARAFGFTMRDGTFWVPPEDPVYPEAALRASRFQILSIERQVAREAAVTALAI